MMAIKSINKSCNGRTASEELMIDEIRVGNLDLSVL